MSTKSKSLTPRPNNRSENTLNCETAKVKAIRFVSATLSRSLEPNFRLRSPYWQGFASSLSMKWKYISFLEMEEITVLGTSSKMMTRDSSALNEITRRQSNA